MRSQLLVLAIEHGVLTVAQVAEWERRGRALEGDALLAALCAAGLLDGDEAAFLRDLVRGRGGGAVEAAAGADGSGGLAAPTPATRVDPAAPTVARAAGPAAGADATPVGSGAPGTADAEPTPTRLGRYRILGVLGRGGMGTVYRAFDPNLGRTVALKVLPGGVWAAAEALVRFQREAQMAARLAHPNIVRVHEVGTLDETRYFTMDCIEGVSFDRWLAAAASGIAPGREREAIGIVARVAEALHHAHRHGVLHRDLKPGNVLIDAEGSPFMVDFGLGREVDARSEATLSGSVLGTPAYMPPEQAAGRPADVDVRSDVYGLGAILYHVLAGEAPFAGATLAEILKRVIEVEPVPPRRRNPKVPPDLEVICLKCLEKDKTRRYASAADVAADLRRYLAGEPILARPASTLYRVRRWVERRRSLAATLAGLVFLAIVMSVRVLGPARIVLVTDPPDAHVTLDGRPYASSAWFWPWGGAGLIVPEKRFCLRVTAPGYEPLDVAVPLSSFTVRDLGVVRLAPDHGFLAVASDPSAAELWLDGKDTGLRTPVAPTPVRNGLHEIELRRAGARGFRAPARIVAGETLDFGTIDTRR